MVLFPWHLGTKTPAHIAAISGWLRASMPCRVHLRAQLIIKPLRGVVMKFRHGPSNRDASAGALVKALTISTPGAPHRDDGHTAVSPARTLKQFHDPHRA